MKKEERKAQILQNACSLFAARGYDAATVAQIAEKCGCSSALIIRYFGSKEGIYEALLDELREACREPLIDAVPEGSPMEKLESIYRTFMGGKTAFESRHEQLISALQSRNSSQGSVAEAMRGMQDVGTDILLPILRSGVRDGTFPPDFPCEKTARILWLYMSGNSHIRASYPSEKPLPFSEIRRMILHD
ncbi:MAG: TetR/AcrR family transcriptional regulator [Lachnospiraceae bacterium]|jgi:AcrR family transcriptional regulator